MKAINSNDITLEAGGWPTPGTYSLFSHYDKEAIAITSQGLLDLAAYVEEHRTEIEAEAIEGNIESIDKKLRG